MTIPEIESQIISEFSLFEDWMDKYNYLIELGKSLPVIDPKYKTDQYLISGCQSQVWLHAEYKDGKVFYTADSDAIITKGIVNLLIRVLSDQSPGDIISTDLSFIDQIGLREHLSPTRSNGLNSMIKQMKLYAVVFKTKYLPA
ncbi:MAG: SufE family protein [Bacteroidales bacterium]|nr:SufE family protein [Bacteroidales bacterium]